MAQQNQKCGTCDSGKAQTGTLLLDLVNEPEVSIQDTRYEMLLKVTGHKKGNGANANLGKDIVMVLDTSRSMRDGKLDAMKRAAKLMVHKLSELDRLWIVTFERNSQEEWDFDPMTSDEKEEANEVIDDLTAHGDPNIGAALRRGLNLLREQKSDTTGRHTAIMLMSDGIQLNGNAAQVSFDRIPVFAFGFGTDAQCNSQILKQIVGKSKGGSFFLVDHRNLNDVIRKIMDCWSSKPIKDVKLVIIPIKADVSRGVTCTTEIKNVYAGHYLTSRNDKDKSVTVSFGSLRDKEERIVLIDLFLPKVAKMVHIDSLRLNCSYMDDKGTYLRTNPLIFRVKRYENPKVPPTYAKSVEMAKHELSIHKTSQVVKHGPYGSQLQQNYRFQLQEGESIKEVIIIHGFIVDAIGFVIEKQGGNAPTKKLLFGGTRGDESKIEIKRGEYITRISGEYGNYRHGNLCLIGKIRVHTNFCPIGRGPYGQARDMVSQTPFSTPVPSQGPVVGFFGRHNNYLESVGIFVKQDC